MIYFSFRARARRNDHDFWEHAMPSFDITCRMAVFPDQSQVDAAVFFVSIQP